MYQSVTPTDEPVDRDAELHAAIIAGKEDALAEFERRYRLPFIARGVAKGLSVEDAEDAFQDIFLSTAQRASTLEGPLGLSLRRYANGAMGFRIAEYLDNRSRGPKVVTIDTVGDDSAQLRAPEPASAEPQSDEHTRAAVRRCLEGLSEGGRAILEAIYFGQLSPELAAESLVVARNTLYKGKTRALDKIRPCLDQALHVND
jgi:RNA polymerase sigma factor (sigma-70 family)